eukprot:Skav234326  [mRNA]  locus=scaffold3161:83957:85178:- [translate_table: standard]
MECATNCSSKSFATCFAVGAALKACSADSRMSLVPGIRFAPCPGWRSFSRMAWIFLMMGSTAFSCWDWICSLSLST